MSAEPESPPVRAKDTSSPVKSVYRNAKRFATLYGGLLAKLYRFSPGKTIGVSAFQILGPVLLPLIVLILHKGIKLVQGGPVQAKWIPRQILESLSPVALLGVLSVAIVVIGVLGAVCGWLGAAGARKLGRLYRLNLAESMLSLIANAAPGTLRLPAPMASETRLHQATVTHGLKLNLAVISLFTAIRHGASVLFLTLSLIVVEPVLSLVFFGAALLVLPLYYVLHKRTHRASKNWVIEGGARESAKGLMALGSEANTLPEPQDTPGEPRDYSAAIRENSSIIENLETMEFGRLSGAKSQLYGNLFRALFLGGGLYLFGHSALTPGHLTWDSLVLFLVGASMLQVSITALFNSLSMLVWHAPPVATILDYEKALRGGNVGRKGKRKHRTREFTGRHQGAAEAKSVLLVSPVEIGRTGLFSTLESLRIAGVFEKSIESLDFQVPRLKGRNLPVNRWRELLPDYAPGPELTLIEIGNQGKEAKATAIVETGFSRVVVRTDSWSDPLDPFDYIVKVEAQGGIEGGDREYWHGRTDLASAKAGEGLDLEMDLDLELEG